MKTILPLIATVLGLAFGQVLPAQDAKKTDTLDKSKESKDSAPQANSDKPKPSQDELEAAFKSALTRATLSGRWCAITDGQLSPEKEEKYTINSVTKIGGDVWLINARIQYGKKDIVAPIPVQVKWAGNTPVILVDKAGVPGSGEYSARVLIYEKTYAGTWSGGDHGGLLHGVITQSKD